MRLSLRKGTVITGSLIAMSVFKPDRLPLKSARGHAYFLYHSPEDKVCPFRFAEQAQAALTRNGAAVQFATYAGGHGWLGDVCGGLRAGIAWLENNHARRGRR